jgi:hypothetical protein
MMPTLEQKRTEKKKKYRRANMITECDAKAKKGIRKNKNWNGCVDICLSGAI